MGLGVLGVPNTDPCPNCNPICTMVPTWVTCYCGAIFV